MLRTGGEEIEFGDIYDLEDVEQDIASIDSFKALIGGRPVAEIGTGKEDDFNGYKDVFTVIDPITRELEDRLEEATSGTVSLIPNSQTVDRVETKPVESMPDMPDSQNTSMIPDLDLKTGGLILAAGVLGLALLRGDS